MTSEFHSVAAAGRLSRRLAGAALLGVAVLGALPAVAQVSFAGKPIRMIVAVGAGGATDTLARRLAERLSKSLGTAVTVENQPGGSGVIAAQAQ